MSGSLEINPHCNQLAYLFPNINKPVKHPLYLPTMSSYQVTFTNHSNQNQMTEWQKALQLNDIFSNRKRSRQDFENDDTDYCYYTHNQTSQKMKKWLRNYTHSIKSMNLKNVTDSMSVSNPKNKAIKNNWVPLYQRKWIKSQNYHSNNNKNETTRGHSGRFCPGETVRNHALGEE